MKSNASKGKEIRDTIKKISQDSINSWDWDIERFRNEISRLRFVHGEWSDEFPELAWKAGEMNTGFNIVEECIREGNAKEAVEAALIASTYFWSVMFRLAWPANSKGGIERPHQEFLRREFEKDPNAKQSVIISRACAALKKETGKELPKRSLNTWEKKFSSIVKRKPTLKRRGG